MARFKKLALFTVVFVLALAGATQAFGATPWESMDVILHEDSSRGVLLVSGTLPKDAPLPAEVALSVPSDAQIQWTGEILGGDPKNDPSVTPVKSTIDGADVYTFTLTKARIGQIEAVVPPASREGTASVASIAWVSPQDVPEVCISGRIPSGSTISQPVDGAELTSGSDGYSYYSKTFTGVSAGDRLDLTFAYTAPATAPSSSAAPVGTSAPSSNTGAIMIIMLVVGIGVGVSAVAVSRKMSARAEDAPVADAAPAKKKASAASSRSESGSKPKSGTSSAPAAPRRKLSPATIMLLILVIVLGGSIFALAQSSKPPAVNGLITRSFGGLSACTTASLSLTPAPGADLGKDGNKLIDSLASVESIGEVTLDVPKSLLTVKYCESSTDEQTIKAALASTGLVSW